MAKARRPDHFVVDGSNIATEGRSQPSLSQLNEAVLAFMDDHHGAIVTVVVDATFGHRIDKKEVKAFDEAVANNELVTPPAGAIGRGDAFVLTIANKANAGVLSNDSFQEFHGEYDWLFDEGRLIGGKPVPHVGWVFVARTPVRGPKSRQSVREAKSGATTDAKERANRRVRAKDESAAAEPDTPKPARARRGRSAAATDAEPTAAPARAADDSAPKEHVNELMPFLDFVEHHPVGTSCTGVVESYASHGAYARVDDVLIYVPLRLMDDPAPRSARSALTIGEAVTVVVVGFVPDRRSIDAALPHMTASVEPQPKKTPAAKKKAAAKKTPAKKSAVKKTPADKSAAKKATAKKTPAAKKKAAAKKTPAKKTAATKSAAKKAAAKTVAKTVAKKTPAKKTPARKTPARKKAAAKTPAKKTPAKKTGGSS
jgi:hypothetical protein